MHEFKQKCTIQVNNYLQLSFRIVIQEQSKFPKLKASLEAQKLETTEGVVSFDSKS